MKKNALDYLNYTFSFITYREFDHKLDPELGLGVSKMRGDINDLLNDRVFENQVGLIYYHTQNKLKHIETKLTQPCDKILSLLEKELERSKPA